MPVEGGRSVSIDRAGRTAAMNRFRRLEAVTDAPVVKPVEPAPPVDPRAVEFVRFCYLRRRVSWPELYDEMCLVAARGSFRGMSYDDLSEVGVSFALAGLPPLIQLSDRVVAEERAVARGLVSGGGGGVARPHPHLTPVAG
jgi:hypothetical protein